MYKIPFNKPHFSAQAHKNIELSLRQNKLENDFWTRRCQQQLRDLTKCHHHLLTNSCTQALEMAAILLDLGPGDEVIMPSYTFVSTANAFALRGAVPVFVDVNPKTLNIDVSQIEQAITQKTKAIVAVHYAAMACDMPLIMDLAKKYELFVVEDAAQCIDAYFEDKHLGTIGHLGAFSFHHTKNIHSGLGGALLINDKKLVERAYAVWQKGTNREAFLHGKVDKYTWVDLGSSYLMSEITAALLSAQLDEVKEVTKKRLDIWNYYQAAFKNLGFGLPGGNDKARHNGHLFYLLLPSFEARSDFISHMQKAGIQVATHYEPLHSSVAGKKWGLVSQKLFNTDDLACRLVRLPLFSELTEEELDFVKKSVELASNNC